MLSKLSVKPNPTPKITVYIRTLSFSCARLPWKQNVLLCVHKVYKIDFTAVTAEINPFLFPAIVIHNLFQLTWMQEETDK